eukprot:3192116-Rhodomonas_salina.1
MSVNLKACQSLRAAGRAESVRWRCPGWSAAAVAILQGALTGQCCAPRCRTPPSRATVFKLTLHLVLAGSMLFTLRYRTR